MGLCLILTSSFGVLFQPSQIHDPSRIYVSVALGFHVEFTLPEAKSFASIKRDRLSLTLDRLKERETEIAQDVDSAEALLRSLRNLLDRGTQERVA